MIDKDGLLTLKFEDDCLVLVGEKCQGVTKDKF
jgi:hypothetical protein